MSLAELPGWLRYRTGTCPIIIVAPHGGERAREIRRGDGMNDLYTAEIADELAARLDAYAVINHGIDRNEIDLNRITAIVERAPALLRVLRDAVTRAGTASAGRSAVVPLVLFVHGWNISSLACDIGIGLRECGGQLCGAHATISPATLRRFVEPLRDAFAERGLEGFVGHRYPASGRDNATQLFSGRHLGHADADVAHLSRLALDGRVDAVQLELTIPLRWPGAYRERWLAAVETAVAQYLTGAAEQPLASIGGRGEAARKWAAPLPVMPVAVDARASEPASAPKTARGESIQAVLADGSGLFMGVEPAGRDALAARICIARPDGVLALFVCEAPWSGKLDRFAAGGFEWRPGHRVRYAGPAVRYTTHDAFVDLEGGLRSAELIDIEVEIAFGQGGKKTGRSAGYVRMDKQSVDISPLLLRGGGGRFTGMAGVNARVTFTETAGGTVTIEDGAPVETADGDRRTDARRHEEGPRRVPGRIVFGDDGARVSVSADPLGAVGIEGVVTVRVPVYRPAPGGGFVKVVFGVADVVSDGRFGPRALFEVVRKIRASG